MTCSGLPIVRYTHAELAAQFPGYDLVATSGEEHVTPGAAPNSSPPCCYAHPSKALWPIILPMGIEEVLTRSRHGVTRHTPETMLTAARAGALIIDTRTEPQRRDDGELPGALVIDRTVLEWRLDPLSPSRIDEATGYDVEVVVVCRHGFSSSLAAASLRDVGLRRATDLAGGMAAYVAAGLPVDRGPADVRR